MLTNRSKEKEPVHVEHPVTKQTLTNWRGVAAILNRRAEAAGIGQRADHAFIDSQARTQRLPVVYRAKRARFFSVEDAEGLDLDILRMHTTRPTHSDETRNQALELAREGLSYAEISRRISPPGGTPISRTTIRNWVVKRS